MTEHKAVMDFQSPDPQGVDAASDSALDRSIANAYEHYLSCAAVNAKSIEAVSAWNVYTYLLGSKALRMIAKRKGLHEMPEVGAKS